LFTVLPFGYEMLGIDDTLKNCVELIKGGADAIRIQGGGTRKLEKIRRLTEECIPCAGHLGLLPLYTTWIGGFRCQGKKADIAAKLYRDALRVQEAGAIWIEMECVPYKVAAEITKRTRIPIIGIGSGPYCDGEVQVPFDTLGIHDGHYPKHSKKYMDYYNMAIKAFSTYRDEVLKNKFPTKDYSFEIEDAEYEIFLEKIDKIKE
jgi:3-methyl-2-oxobutanoate hydroxymethyltransferase